MKLCSAQDCYTGAKIYWFSVDQPKPQERVAKKKAQLDLSEDELNDEEEDEEEEEEDELEATEHKSRKVAADTTPTTTKDGSKLKIFEFPTLKKIFARNCWVFTCIKLFLNGFKSCF